MRITQVDMTMTRAGSKLLKEKIDLLELESVLHYLSQPPQRDEDIKFILKHFELK